MAEIAVALTQALNRRQQTGEAGGTTARPLASGSGWHVADVICTCGPQDRAFEETHRQHAVAYVVAGMFEVRDRHGRRLMTPGSTMLGNPGASFECSHTHRIGDRCVAFWYSEEYLETVRAAHRGRSTRARFEAPAVPPGAATAGLVARCAAGASAVDDESAWGELAALSAGLALSLSSGERLAATQLSGAVEARVAGTVRFIERGMNAPISLDALAALAGMSPCHFLRVFHALTGPCIPRGVRRLAAPIQTRPMTRCLV